MMAKKKIILTGITNIKIKHQNAVPLTWRYKYREKAIRKKLKRTKPNLVLKGILRQRVIKKDKSKFGNKIVNYVIMTSTRRKR